MGLTLFTLRVKIYHTSAVKSDSPPRCSFVASATNEHRSGLPRTLTLVMKDTNQLPITITTIKGNNVVSQMMGLMTTFTTPLIHGCQSHYFPFESWREHCKATPEWFHVACFPIPDKKDDENYKSFISEMQNIPFNFMTLDARSKILAWKIGSNKEIVTDSLIPFESGIVKPIKEVVLSFFRNNYDKNAELVSPLYIHDKHKNKVELLIPDFEIIDKQLMEFFGKNPHVMHHLHHRKFEEFLAALFKDLGYDVELGPGGGDGGVDLRLISKTDTGPLLFLVQAKKYAPNRPIGLQPVQALFGAVEAEKASQGILVSTSYFQPAVKKFVGEVPFRVQLAGPVEIQNWIWKVFKNTKVGR